MAADQPAINVEILDEEGLSNMMAFLNLLQGTQMAADQPMLGVKFHDNGWSFSPSTATLGGDASWYMQLPNGLRFPIKGNFNTTLYMPMDILRQAPSFQVGTATRGTSAVAVPPSAVRDMPDETSSEED